MTPPMTPREKVAKEIVDRTSVGTLGLTYEASLTAALDLADAIFTALASGSGDHAELEVVGWRIEDLILPQQTFTTDEAYARHRAAYRYEGEVTATVEPLVTAASAEARTTELRSAYCAAESDAMTLRKRATEAERKLAEAVGLLQRLADYTEKLGENLERNDLDMHLDACERPQSAVQPARTFLSKEAERG